MPDDSVEIVAQADEESLNKLIEWVKQGPDSAKVEKVDVSHETSNEEFKDFIIR